jgi:glycosyl transferase family 25
VTPPTVFVINLQRDSVRRAQMRERLDAIGLPFRFLDAVVGDGLDLDTCTRYDGVRRRRYFGRDMTRGEVGCLLSHLKAYEIMVEEGIDTALVLEDDVMFEPDFPDVLRALHATPVRWDIVRFLGSEKIYRLGRRIIAPLVGRYFMARIPGAHGGAHAYLLTRAAAGVLLEHTRRSWMPIDTLHGRCWETGLESLVVHPAPLHTDPAAGSTISDARFDKTVRLQGIDRTLYPLRRFWFRFTETLGKRRVYWSSWWRDGRAATTRD